MSAIGNEYGNAIFLLAEEEGALDEVLEGLSECAKVFGESPEYVDFLETPSIPLAERLEALHSAFGGSVPARVEDFLCLLTERGYMRFFPDCVKEYEDRYDLLFNITLAEAVSAKPLTVEERQALRDKLQRATGKRIKLKCEVDEQLVGGLIVRIDGRLYDGSIRSRINEIQEAMIK